MTALAQTKSMRSDPRLAVVRMLIASYFLASAGLIENAQGTTFLTGVLPPGPAEAVASTIYYATAFAIMIGRFVREAALILALFVFWSSFDARILSAQPGLLMEFWRDMALVGAVVLTGLIQTPGRRRKLRLPFLGRRRPRRVAMRTALPPKSASSRPQSPLPPEVDNIFNDLETA